MMPNLNISKSWTDFFFVYAAMVHPHNELYRDELVAVLVSRCVLEGNENESDIEIPSSLLRVLLNAPGYEEVLTRASEGNKKGIVAGDLLDYIAQMYCAGYKQPSVRKAVYVAEEYLSNAIDGYGKKGGSSDIFIYECWREHKSVAHLWAALRVCQFDPNNDFLTLNEIPLEGGLDKFLAVSETFRLFGESYIPPIIKSREPLLSPLETWKVPENYSLPPIYLHHKSLPDWMTERLEGYSKRPK